MRVLMTSDTVGGVWTYAVELARAMTGGQFVLAVLGGGRPTAAQLRQLPANIKLVTNESRLDQAEAPWADAGRTAEWLLELERQEAPDLVHLNGYAHGALPFRAPKLVVGHSCALTWSKALNHDYEPELWAHYRATVSAGLRGADFVVASSLAMLDALHQHYDFSTPARVIYNGLSTQGPSIRSTAGERPVVLAIGERSDAARNIETVIEAVPLIHAPVTIAGALEREEMKDAMDDASIYLSPALYDPFGESTLQAAQSACALVLGDIPSVREIWHDAALFAPPMDALRIAQQVNSLLSNPYLRDDMAHRARRRAAEFTPQRMAGDYQLLYRLLQLETIRVKSPSSDEALRDSRAAGSDRQRPDGYQSTDNQAD